MCAADAANPGWGPSGPSCANVVQSGASCTYDILTAHPVTTRSRSYTGVPICPANSTKSGTTCICNTGFKPDPSATRCDPEQYTISLHGLGGQVMPNQTRDAYAAVAKSDGTASAGVQVDLKLAVVPEEDGYNHAAGQHTAQHEGKLLPNAASTDWEGKLHFVFKAPEAGGTHTITATCTKCTNQDSGTIKVPGCPVEPLAEVNDLSNIWDTTDEQKQLTEQLESDMNGYSLLSDATKAGERCLADRINSVVSPPSGYKITSTIRTPAYQKHLRNVWDKFWDLKGKVDKDPTLEQRCEVLISEVEGQMGFRLTQNPRPDAKPKADCNPALGRAHCIRFPPADADPKHVAKTAFDINSATVDAFQSKLHKQRPRSTVAQEANACNLKWGGLFGDRVHFACCVN